MRILSLIGLSIGISILLAARLLAAPFDKAACGCNLDPKRFNNDDYIRRQSVLFSAANLRNSFQQPNINTPQAQNIIDIALRDYATMTRADLQARTQQIDAEFGTLLAQDNSLKKLWEIQRGKIYAAAKGRGDVKMWTIYTICSTADILHQYYAIHPHKNNSNQASNPAAPNQNQTINMQTMIIVASAAAGAAFLLAILVSWLLLRSKPEDPQAATQAVLQSPQFNGVFNKFAASIESQINAALQDQNQRIFERLQQAASPDKSTEIAALEQKIKDMPVVDVGLIERLLNDFNGRIGKLEQAPKTKYEIHFSAEEFGEFLKRNRELIAALREALHVNTLQATIMSLLPKPLDLKNLDEIQQETLRHHWRLFNLNPDFLPKFKADIMQEVRDAIQRR